MVLTTHRTRGGTVGESTPGGGGVALTCARHAEGQTLLEAAVLAAVAGLDVDLAVLVVEALLAGRIPHVLQRPPEETLQQF